MEREGELGSRIAYRRKNRTDSVNGRTVYCIVITTIMVEVLKIGLAALVPQGDCTDGNDEGYMSCAASYQDILQAIIVPKVLVVPATGLIGFSRESRRLASDFGDKNGDVYLDRLCEFCLLFILMVVAVKRGTV